MFASCSVSSLPGAGSERAEIASNLDHFTDTLAIKNTMYCAERWYTAPSYPTYILCHGNMQWRPILIGGGIVATYQATQVTR